MSTKIFVNLPVKDLHASKKFYEAVGFRNNPQFTDENAACMIISEEIYIMLLTHEFFKTFAVRPIGDAQASTAALFAISRESRAEVDKMMDAALAAGGREPRPAQEMGFMYGRAFEDPDGHTWEPNWIDPATIQK